MTNAPKPTVGRRGLLAGGGAAALAGLLATPAMANPAATAADAAMPLGFKKDGTFKIVQFNDTQDGPLTDRRTIELMENVLDQEKPGFALINGDVINGSPRTDLEVRQAVNNVVLPMEERGIPWALTFGNHDEDSLSHGTGMTEPKLLDFIQTYKHNLNAASAKGTTGTSNTQLLVRSATGKGAAFGIWLLDSGRYAPDAIAGQDFAGYPDWDWIRPDQIQWYRERSIATEQRFGAKVPSLMFFHIALWEHRFMWFASVDGRTEADHERAVGKHSIVGERHEDECPGPFNSGMFAALQERGDVRGVFVGHDHINTYAGDYYGIKLGYGPGTGFGTYGLGGPQNHRLRGARVYELDENVEGVFTSTRNVFASDFGMDLSTAKQPLEKPRPLGAAQR